MLQRLIALDKRIFDYFTKIEHRSRLAEKAMIFFTHLGDWGFIWVVSALLLICLRPYRRYGLFCLGSVLACSFVVNVLLKKTVRRNRPFIPYLPKLTLKIKLPPDFSFPSGHTAASFAAAGILAYINPTVAITAYVVALLISFSRLYLLVHYPFDIIVGAVLGAICAFCFSLFMVM